jgi:hypothetical protein
MKPGGPFSGLFPGRSSSGDKVRLRLTLALCPAAVHSNPLPMHS